MRVGETSGFEWPGLGPWDLQHVLQTETHVGRYFLIPFSSAWLCEGAAAPPHCVRDGIREQCSEELCAEGATFHLTLWACRLPRCSARWQMRFRFRV